MATGRRGGDDELRMYKMIGEQEGVRGDANEIYLYGWYHPERD